jgi:hypothetical protein
MAGSDSSLCILVQQNVSSELEEAVTGNKDVCKGKERKGKTGQDRAVENAAVL